jgi:single-stranded DNA-binding protein
MTSQIYVDGRLSRNPELGLTQKGKPQAKLLIETEVVRQVRKGEFQAETSLIPVTVYGWLVDDVRKLKGNDRLSVCTHAVGTAFTMDSGEVRYGVMLIADFITYPPAFRPAPPVRELT